MTRIRWVFAFFASRLTASLPSSKVSSVLLSSTLCGRLDKIYVEICICVLYGTTYWTYRTIERLKLALTDSFPAAILSIQFSTSFSMIYVREIILLNKHCKKFILFYFSDSSIFLCSGSGPSSSVITAVTVGWA